MVEKISLSVKDAARKLSLGRSSLHKVMAEGGLPWIKLGKRRLILVDDLNAYIAANRHVGAAEARYVPKAAKRQQPAVDPLLAALVTAASLQKAA